MIHIINFRVMEQTIKCEEHTPIILNTEHIDDQLLEKVKDIQENIIINPNVLFLFSDTVISTWKNKAGGFKFLEFSKFIINFQKNVFSKDGRRSATNF